jgi:hypothetical protein
MVQHDEHADAELLRFIRGERCIYPEWSEPISDVELWAVEHELGTLLPPSYHAFVRHFGSARVGEHELFGLPRNQLWGDIVLMNQLAIPILLPAYVMFSQDRQGRQYCFDVSRRDADGECPVVAGSAPMITVAQNFLAFLCKVVFGEI